MKHSVRKKLLAAAGIAAAVAALCAGAFFWYVSDYYRAEDVALEVMARGTGITVEGDFTILSPSVPSDTGIVFYPGAKVEAEAYLPLLDRIRRTGVTCVLVHMPFNMAIFDPGAAEDVFPLFPQIEHWYVAGHSMGGAMASDFASKHPEEVDGLILLGAYIYGDYPDEKTLTVYGSLNQSVEDHIDYTENIVEIEGGNHAQFGNYGPQKGDAPAAISAQEQQEQTAEAVEAFLNRWIRTEKAPLRGFFSACRKPPRRPEQRESRGKRGRFGRILRDRMCFLHRSVGCGAFLLRNVSESSERN